MKTAKEINEEVSVLLKDLKEAVVRELKSLDGYVFSEGIGIGPASELNTSAWSENKDTVVWWRDGKFYAKRTIPDQNTGREISILSKGDSAKQALKGFEFAWTHHKGEVLRSDVTVVGQLPLKDHYPTERGAADAAISWLDDRAEALREKYRIYPPPISRRVMRIKKMTSMDGDMVELVLMNDRVLITNIKNVDVELGVVRVLLYEDVVEGSENKGMVYINLPDKQDVWVERHLVLFRGYWDDHRVLIPPK